MYSKDSQLKNFTVLERLGKGSFGSVYKVQRFDDHICYALKKVKIGEMKDRQKQNALNEVRILASISHPNIINYKQAFFDDATQSLCIVMQLADEGDIQKKIDKHKQCNTHFTETQIWKALIQIVRGLSSLHQINILHRDLKCANVFCSKDDKYKLGDLNVSKVAKRGMAKTQTGTPYYTSPQVWKDKQYDSKCDIWSLGCVIYEMAKLSPPFRASSLKELYTKIQRGIFQRIPSFYSQDLQRVINQLLKVNPKQRPNSLQILNYPKVKQYISSSQYYNHSKQQAKSSLLKTIHLPRNLRNLKQALPKSKYNSERQPQVQQPKIISRPISQRKYQRVNSAQNLGSNKPHVQIPRVINSPKVQNLKSNQIKYAFMRRPLSSGNKEHKSQCRQVKDISKNMAQPYPSNPRRISRNNSVDSIRKRVESNISKQLSKQKIKQIKNGMEDITHRIKQAQQNYQNIMNRRKQIKNNQSNKDILLPRINSRQRIVSANKQYQIQKMKMQKRVQRSRSFQRCQKPASKDKSFEKYKCQEKQKSVKKMNINSQEKYNRPMSGSRKKYVYNYPPKLR